MPEATVIFLRMELRTWDNEVKNHIISNKITKKPNFPIHLYPHRNAEIDRRKNIVSSTNLDTQTQQLCQSLQCNPWVILRDYENILKDIRCVKWIQDVHERKRVKMKPCLAKLTCSIILCLRSSAALAPKEPPSMLVSFSNSSLYVFQRDVHRMTSIVTNCFNSNLRP